MEIIYSGLGWFRALSRSGKVLAVIGGLLLLYMILPGPRHIGDFAALPDSVRSKLSGDNLEVPEIKAYFSNDYRAFVTNFYGNDYWWRTWFWLLPPLRLNHPPETAFTKVKIQTQSTYLEEFVYPLRDSLMVNGLEPFLQSGEPRYWGASEFTQDGGAYKTKTTLRFYPSPFWVKLVLWAGIMASLYWLWKMTRVVLSREKGDLR